MIDYHELRGKLDNAPQDGWEQILEDAIERYESKVDELRGKVMGFAASDVEVEDDRVTASVYYCMLGDCIPDEDGDGYDQEESEYHFVVSITQSGTKWESA